MCTQRGVLGEAHHFECHRQPKKSRNSAHYRMSLEESRYAVHPIPPRRCARHQRVFLADRTWSRTMTGGSLSGKRGRADKLVSPAEGSHNCGFLDNTKVPRSIPFREKRRNQLMPLPTDEKLLKLSQDLLQQFDTLFGLYPGFRPAHAKGAILMGRFTPSRDVVSLSRAPHLNRESAPVTVRFSDSTGIPVIPDNDPNASPRGGAIRFHLATHAHTDIIAHSTDGFPTRTGE